jgi:hypothetical protein
VSRLRHIFALALAALWLPATLHCDLEAAGLDDLFHCLVDHHSTIDLDGSHTPSRDACDVVEGTALRLVTDTALVAPPALHALSACLLSFVAPDPALVLTPPPSGLTDRIEPPPEVARTWHFTARAALPSRAPSLV